MEEARPEPRLIGRRRRRAPCLITCIGLAAAAFQQADGFHPPTTCPILPSGRGDLSGVRGSSCSSRDFHYRVRARGPYHPSHFTTTTTSTITHVATRSSSEPRVTGSGGPGGGEDRGDVRRGQVEATSYILPNQDDDYEQQQEEEEQKGGAEEEGTGGGVTVSMFRERTLEDEEMMRRKERERTPDVMMQLLEDGKAEEADLLQDSLLKAYIVPKVLRAPPPHPPLNPDDLSSTTTTSDDKSVATKPAGSNWLSSVWGFVTGGRRGARKADDSSRPTASDAVVGSKKSQEGEGGVKGEGGATKVAKKVKKKKRRKKDSSSKIKAKDGGGFDFWGLTSLFKRGDNAAPAGTTDKKRKKKKTVKDTAPSATTKTTTTTTISSSSTTTAPLVAKQEQEDDEVDFEFYGLSPVLISPKQQQQLNVSADMTSLLPPPSPPPPPAPLLPPPEAEGPTAEAVKEGGFDWWGIGSFFSRAANTTDNGEVDSKVKASSSKGNGTEGGGYDWWGLARSSKVNTTSAVVNASVSAKPKKEGGGGFDWWGLFGRKDNATTIEAKRVAAELKANMTTRSGEGGAGFDWWGIGSLFSRKDNNNATVEAKRVNGTKGEGGGFDWWGLFGRKDNDTTVDGKEGSSLAKKEEGGKEGEGFDWWGLGSLFNRGNGTEAKRSGWVAPEDESDYYAVEGKGGPSSLQRQVSRFVDGVGRLFNKPGGNSTSASSSSSSSSSSSPENGDDDEKGEGAPKSSAPSSLFAGSGPMLNMLRSAWEEQWGGGSRDSDSPTGPSKPRPDDMVKLPKNMEEVLDQLADDTRHLINSLSQAFPSFVTIPEKVYGRPVAKGTLFPRPTVIVEPLDPPQVLEAPPLVSTRFRDEGGDESSSGLSPSSSLSSRTKRWRPREGSSSRASPSNSSSFRALRSRVKTSGEMSAPLSEDDDVSTDMDVDSDEETIFMSPPISPLSSLSVDDTVPTPLPPPLPRVPRESKRVVVASWLSGVVESIKPTDREVLLERRRVLSARVPRKMDDRFLRTVSRKLQNDRLRIKEFQLQTDRFRNSLMSGQAYYDSVLSLFGSLDDADEILLPLMDTLPEPSKRRELMEVYAGRRRKGFENISVERSAPSTVSNVLTTVGGVISGTSGAVASWAKSLVAAVAARSKSAPPPADSTSSDIEAGDAERQEEGYWEGSSRSSLAAQMLEEVNQEFSVDDDGQEELAEDEMKEAIWQRVLEGQDQDQEVDVEEEATGSSPEEAAATVVPAEVKVKKPVLSAAEREAKKRELLGERNLSYFQLRLDLYKRGDISGHDFYRSLKNFAPLGDPTEVIEMLIDDESILEDKYKARYLKELHEASVSSRQKKDEALGSSSTSAR